MSEQEFTVRIPQRNEQKKYYVMKFNSSLGIDVSKWNQVRMVRENNQKVKAQGEEEQPKFGAGSVFGREQKEEARRKKFGMVSKKYDPDAQPWLMRVGSKKEGKHYKGLREGGVSNNTTYYVFTHAQDGSFEVHPVKEWYNFTPRANYKTLNAEEAEEKFAERSKILNHWAVMVNKKLRPDGGDDADDFGDEEGKGSKKSKANKSGFKVSDMDEWVDDEDGLDSSDEGSDAEDGGGKKKKNKKDDAKGGKDSRKKKKKSKEDVENEAFEDSDDGDDEAREVDYITDESSEGEEEIAEAVELKGVEQDEGLSKLLDSESSSDEDEEKKKEEKEENDEEKEEGGKKGKKGKKKSKEEKAKDKAATASGGDSKDDDTKGGKKSAPGSRATTPTPPDAADEKSAQKRKIVDNLLDPNAGPDPKKSRMDPFGPSTSGSSSSAAATSTEAMFEEDVRRYLARKPMTTTEILKKIKSRKTGIPKEELMPLLVSALKRINPHKQKVKGIMYLSLKTK